jgi:hypothetical protein
MVSQLQSVSQRLNFVCRYLFRVSWVHYQEGFIVNTIKLIEISILVQIVVKRVPIIKVVENCAMCYDENYNIENTRLYKDLCLK